MKNAKTQLRQARDIGCIVLGVLLMVCSYNLFFIGNSIAPGGFTGLATVLHALFGWRVGVLVILLNLPLFLLGFRHMGLKYFVTSVVTTVGFSMLLDFIPIYSFTEDLLLASVYGGFLLGAGLGLVLLGGGTTGGSDMAAQLLHRRFPGLRVAWLLLAIDAFVVIVAGLTLGAQMSLYALISLLISSKIVDMIQSGASSAKAFFIITSKAEAISRRVLNEMERGMTSLKGEGMYSGEGRNMLFCVVYRTQVAQLKTIIAEEDETAFVVVNDVREVMGKNFLTHTKPQKAKKGGA